MTPGSVGIGHQTDIVIIDPYGADLAYSIVICVTPGFDRGRISLADHSKTSQACNPTMELARSAACVSHDASSKLKLVDPLNECTDNPVTIDYLAGFHSGI